MTEKAKKPSTDAELKAQSLSRWENEGGTKAGEHGAARKTPKRPRDPNRPAKLMVVLPLAK